MPGEQPARKKQAGLRIKISYEAVIAEDQFDEPGVIRVIRNGVPSPWTELLDKIDIEVLGPDVVPGTILSAGGALWVARRSNKRDPLRIMPVDLSGRLRTLDIRVFAERYPKAKILFDPRLPARELEDWERDFVKLASTPD